MRASTFSSATGAPLARMSVTVARHRLSSKRAVSMRSSEWQIVQVAVR